MTQANYDTLAEGLRAVTAALEACKKELTEDRMEMREVTTRLATMDKGLNKLTEVVIEGNGDDSLKSKVGHQNRDIRKLTEEVAELKKAYNQDRIEDKKIQGQRVTTLLAACVTVLLTVLNLIFKGK